MQGVIKMFAVRLSASSVLLFLDATVGVSLLHLLFWVEIVTSQLKFAFEKEDKVARGEIKNLLPV